MNQELVQQRYQFYGELDTRHEQRVNTLALLGSVVFEPIDWGITIHDILKEIHDAQTSQGENQFDPAVLLGLLPLVPGGLRKADDILTGLRAGLSPIDLLRLNRYADDAAELRRIELHYDETQNRWIARFRQNNWPPNRTPLEPNPDLRIFNEAHNIPSGTSVRIPRILADDLGWTENMQAFEDAIRSGNYGVMVTYVEDGVEKQGLFPVEFLADRYVSRTLKQLRKKD
jgi:hypothetical protein